MDNNVNAFFKKPELFEKSKDNTWTSKVISDLIFESHFSDNIFGGSESSEYIETVIYFIQKKAPIPNFMKILDIGCGPGLYSSKLSEKGYHVTGIDISERSIQFAKGQSENEESDTTYLCMDIFDYNFELKYNIILMLYNMYSSFDKDSRLYLLRNIYASLDNGGKFLFDVPSMNWYDSCSEINTWDHYSKLLVNKKIVDFYKLSKYKEGVILINSIYLDEFINITNTYDWFKCFELNELLQEVESVGFKVEGIYSKTNGESYSPDSHTISLLCEK